VLGQVAKSCDVRVGQYQGCPRVGSQQHSRQHAVLMGSAGILASVWLRVYARCHGYFASRLRGLTRPQHRDGGLSVSADKSSGSDDHDDQHQAAMEDTEEGGCMRADVGEGELLFVPARPWPFEGGRQVAIETRTVASGQQVGLVFTSPGRLASELGECQPWVAMRAGWVRSALAARGVDRIVVDPALPRDERFWRWERGRLEQLTGGRDG
jgi:hypothetical protein